MPLCAQCNALDLRDRSTRLGSYDDIVTKANAANNESCEGCKFFLDLLHFSISYKDRLSVLKGRIVWLDGLRLDVRKVEREDCSTWSSDDLVVDICFGNEYPDPHEVDEEMDQKRIIPLCADDAKCFEQIQSWLSSCSEHSTCPKPKNVVLPERIIVIPADPKEVPKVVLSEGKKGEFVVLSYCAGNAAILEFAEGFPVTLDMETLPKTLADAITITRKLGFRYLWTSNLLPNGSKSYSLSSIYGQAALMIAATEGRDSNAGIFHDRIIHYSPALGTNKDRYLRSRYLRWQTWDIDLAPLGQTGQAAIERILAPRIVHFTAHQMIYECTSGWQFEASGIIDSKRGSGQIRQVYRKSFVQPYISQALNSTPLPDLESLSIDDGLRKETERLEAWYTCVSEFSDKTLTKPEDRLSAIAPLAALLNDGNMGEYLAGVWSKDITAALSWGRNYKLLTSSPTYRAPSWSWASVDGPVSPYVSGWPETLLADHAKDPAWITRYGPKLISHEMLLANPSEPYTGFLEGSNIVLEASYMGLQKLAESVNEDEGLHMNIVLDQSPVFECSCCIKRPDEERKVAADKFNSEIEHHICMIVQGDAWRVGETWEPQKGFCALVVLRRVLEKEGETFVRVGFGAMGASFNAKGPELNKAFDALEWERKIVKVI